MKRKCLICLLLLLFVCLFAGTASAEGPARVWTQGHGVGTGDTISIYYLIGAENLPDGASLGVLVFDDSEQVFFEKGYEAVDLRNVCGVKNGFSVFCCSGIGEKQVTDTFFAVPYILCDGEYLYGETDSYSILQYNAEISGKTGYLPREKDLVDTMDALLTRGAEAQTEASYHTDRLATDSYTFLSVRNGFFADGRISGAFRAGDEVTLYAIGNSIVWKDGNGQAVGSGASLRVTVGEDSALYTAVCTHNYTKTVKTLGYRKTAATCLAPAVYYYSCKCGAVGDTTFEGTVLGAHIYDREVKEDRYLASAKSCTMAESYYYSCVCGEAGSEVFAVGSRLGHSYYGNTCSRCGELKPSQNLSYRSNGDGTCSVSVGSCTDKVVKIPSVSPAGDLVTAIADNGFKGKTALTGVVLPSGLTSVGTDAFSGCSGLTGAYYYGTLPDWSSLVSVQSGNSKITGNLYAFSRENPGVFGRYWSDENGIVSLWPEEDDGFGRLIPLK